MADAIRVRTPLSSGQATAPGRCVTGLRAHRRCINCPVGQSWDRDSTKRLGRVRGSDHDVKGEINRWWPLTELHIPQIQKLLSSDLRGWKISIPL